MNSRHRLEWLRAPHELLDNAPPLDLLSRREWQTLVDYVEDIRLETRDENGPLNCGGAAICADPTAMGDLVRRVPLSPLIKSVTVDYLFMCGRPSRFNTAGVKCVYFAEDDDTAAAEYERHTRPLHQSFATFFADGRFAFEIPTTANNSPE